MNIFTKIGKQIEERKKKRRIFKDKYWKLSSSERMDYDIKLIRIKNKGFKIGFPLTALVIGIIFFLGLLIFLLAFGGNFPLDELRILLRPLSIEFAKLICWTLLFDAILMTVALLTDKTVENRKELNKRFKL